MFLTRNIPTILGSQKKSDAKLVSNARSIVFDGTDEYINLGSDFKSITQGGTRTVCAWVKASNTDPTDENNRGRIFSIYKADDNSSFAMHAEGASAPANWYYMYRQTDGSGGDIFQSVDSGVNITTNWTHLALTQNGANLKFYINGVEEDSKTDATYLWSASRPAIIGGHLNSTGQSQEFNGNIDEVGLWNSELSATEIKAIYDNVRLDFTKTSVGYTSPSNLAGWWRMGDDADTYVDNDTDTNNLIIPDVRKKFFTNKCIDFDGTNDYIISPSQAFTDTDDFSVSMWIKTTDSVKQGPLFTHPADSTGYWAVKIKANGKVSMSVNDGSNAINSQDDGTTCNDGKWHHVVFTVDRSSGCTHNRYIDNGSPTARGSVSVTGDLDAGDNTYFIGATNGSGNQDNFFNGQIADVAIWDTILDASTIASIYNSGEPNDLTLASSYTGSGGSDKTGNLKGYWRMGNESNYSFPFIPNKNLASLGDNLATGDGTAVGTGVSGDGDVGTDNYKWGPSSDFAGSNSTCDTTSNTGKMTMKHVSSNSNAYCFWKLANTTKGDLYTFSFDYENPTSGHVNIRAGTSGSYVNSLGSVQIQTNAGNGSVTLGEHIIDTYEDGDVYIGIHHSDGANQSDITIDNFVVKKITNNAGIMTNMSQHDVVEHAPNRHSGDMIGFDATGDKTTEIPS